MQLVLQIKDKSNISIQTRKENKMVVSDLTINRYFDTMLIRALDRFVTKNRIRKTSLKTFKIQGKINPESISGLIIKTVQKALGI